MRSSSGTSRKQRDAPIPARRSRRSTVATCIELGYGEGPALGAELARLLDVVIDDPSANERDTLLGLAREALA